jgi:hypothetical protein
VGDGEGLTRAPVLHGTGARSMKASTARQTIVACLAAMTITSACIRTSPSPKASVTERVLGDNVSLYYGSTQGVYGELLALTDTSFILMHGQVWAESGSPTLHIANPSGVVVVPRHAVTRIEFGMKRYDSADGVLTPRDVEEVVHRARFPYSLSAEAMAMLLRANGQSKPDTVAVLP